MRLELYQAETARVAAEQAAIFQSVRDILETGRSLTPLEQAGLLHALQIGIENAIGKAKHWLKAADQVVPISGYDVFQAMVNQGNISPEDLPTWNALIGLRNRIVHDYMNIDIDQELVVICQRREQFVIDFLLREYPER
jgi:uncharacterized protein YutE (UPF0331/DUF86 family)